MTDWGGLKAWDEMIETYIRDGQQYAQDGRQGTADDTFYTAFEVLVRSYQKVMIGFCRNMLQGRVSEVEDVAQDVFLAIWKGMPNFRHEASIRTWIFQIARNHCRDTFRRRFPELMASDEEEDRLYRDLTDATPLPQEQVEHHDFLAWVKEGMGELDQVDREVLVMTYNTDLAPAEIAQLLGIEIASVRQRRRRALHRLREIVKDEHRRARRT